MISIPFSGDPKALDVLEWPMPHDCVGSAFRHHVLSLNLRTLQPGDVFAIHTAAGAEPKGDPARALIMLAQEECGLPPEAARFTHVGIFDGRSHVWDVTPAEDVQRRCLSSFLAAEGEVSVVRFRSASNRNALQAALKKRLCQPYGIGLEIGALLRARIKRDNAIVRKRDFSEKRTICSLFVIDVLAGASGTYPCGDLEIALPGDFLTHNDFSPVEIGWRRLIAPQRVIQPS